MHPLHLLLVAHHGEAHLAEALEERKESIRKQREARRRELDLPTRLAFKRRQLAHSQQAGDAARVAELRREIAALEP